MGLDYIYCKIPAEKISSDLTHFPVKLYLNTSTHSEFFNEMSYTDVDDDFTGNNGDMANTDLWTTSEDTNFEAKIDGNKLLLHNSVSSQGSAAVYANYFLEGDFDIEVHFSSVTVTTNTATVQMFLAGDSSHYFTFFRRYNSAHGNYIGSNEYTGGWGSEVVYLTSVTDLKLGAVRSGSTMYFYRDTGAGWVLHDTRSSIYTGLINVKLSAQQASSNALVSAKADDFIINSGTVIWKLGKHPNRLKLQGVADNLPEELSIEIEEFTNENAVLHLSSPSWILSSGVDNIFRIYYSSLMSNNTTYVGDTGTSPAQNVWDSHFVGVYHMAQDPSGGTGCILDSTSGGNNGTPNGSMTSSDLVETTLGYALDFDGSDDAISLGTSSDFDFTDFSLEAMFYRTSSMTTDSYSLIGSYTTAGNSVHYGLRMQPNGNGLYFYYDDGIAWHGLDASGTFDDDSLGYATGTLVAGTRAKVFVNGVNLGESTSSIPTSMSPTGGVWIARDGDDIPEPVNYPDKIYEVRFSSAARSDDWISASYESLTNNLVSYMYTCAGTTAIDGATTSGIWVRLYKRDDGSFIGATISSGTEGTFSIDTPYNDYHYVIALMPTNSGINGLIYDWLRPGE
jgi:hypothetical protein